MHLSTVHVQCDKDKGQQNKTSQHTLKQKMKVDLKKMPVFPEESQDNKPAI